MTLKPKDVLIRESSAEEKAREVYESGTDASLWDLISAAHYLRYSDRSSIDPMEKYEFLFDEAFRIISSEIKNQDFYSILEAVHRFVRTRFDFKVSSTTAVQMLEKNVFRCETAADFIASVLEQFGFRDIECVYYFDHKQVSVKDRVHNITVVLDPQESTLLHHDTEEFERVSRAVCLSLNEVKRRKLVNLKELLDRETGDSVDTVAVEDAPLDSVYKMVHRAILSRLVPDSVDEVVGATELFDPHQEWSRLGACVVSGVIPFSAPQTRAVNPVDQMAMRLKGLGQSILAYTFLFVWVRAFDHIGAFGTGPTLLEVGAPEQQAIRQIQTACAEKTVVTWVDLTTLDTAFIAQTSQGSSEKNSDLNAWDVFDDVESVDLDDSFFVREAIVFDPFLVARVHRYESNVFFRYLINTQKGFGLASFTPVFFTLNDPYYVYKVEDASQALSFDQLEEVSISSVHCFVAADEEGKIVDVKKK